MGQLDKSRTSGTVYSPEFEEKYQRLKDLLKKRFVERSLKNGVLAERKKKAH